MMGLGPVPATRKVLEKQGCHWKDIDLIETNEALPPSSSRSAVTRF